MMHGHVVDQLHDEHGLPDAGASEESDLPPAQERLNEVNDLDARLEHLQLGGLLFETRRRTMNGIVLVRDDGTELVHRLPHDVEDATERGRPDGHHDRFARIIRFHPPHEPFGRLHRDASHAPFAQVLLDLDDDVNRFGHVEAFARDPKGVVDRGKVILKLHVYDRADDLHDAADFHPVRFLAHIPNPPPPKRAQV